MDIQEFESEKENTSLEESEDVDPSFLKNENVNTQNEIEKKEKIEKINLSNYKTSSIIGVLPLEPIMVFCNIEEKNPSTPSGYKTIGLGGFYDVKNKKFLKLDGSPVDMVNFEEEFHKYIEENLKK